jgi:hypothetical protein
MRRIKLVNQVVQDLTKGSQNTNDMALELGFNYTAYSALFVATGGV